MTTLTLKKVGEQVRRRLVTAQQHHILPNDVIYAVRVANGKTTGPAVHIKIEDYESLLSSTWNTDGKEARHEAVDSWHSDGGKEEQADFIRRVDAVAMRDDYEPKIGGATTFGVLLIWSEATRTRRVTLAGGEEDE